MAEVEFETRITRYSGSRRIARSNSLELVVLVSLVLDFVVSFVAGGCCSFGR